MTFVIALALTLALTALVTRPRKHRIRRTTRWLWAHPATVGWFVVAGYAWHRVGFNQALAVAVAYTALVVIARQLVIPDLRRRRQLSAYRKQPIPRQLRIAVFKRDGFVCVYCGDHRYLTVDHIVPESRGGLATLENLQTLCRSCNSGKGPNGPVIPAPRIAQQGAHLDP